MNQSSSMKKEQLNKAKGGYSLLKNIKGLQKMNLDGTPIFETPEAKVNVRIFKAKVGHLLGPVPKTFLYTKEERKQVSFLLWVWCTGILNMYINRFL